jgi:hypothetical protein
VEAWVTVFETVYTGDVSDWCPKVASQAMARLSYTHIVLGSFQRANDPLDGFVDLSDSL